MLMILLTKHYLSALKCYILIITAIKINWGLVEESKSSAIFKASVFLRRQHLSLSLEDGYIRLHIIDSLTVARLCSPVGTG